MPIGTGLHLPSLRSFCGRASDGSAAAAADAYRLAPADGELTEAEFSKIPLDFVGDGILRYDGDHSTQLPFKATTVSNGTFPPGSQWRKNPISRSPTVRSLPPPRLLPRAAG